MSMALAVLLERGNYPGVTLTVEVNRDLLCLLHGSLVASSGGSRGLCSHSRHRVVGRIITGLLVLEVLLVANAAHDGVIAIYLHILNVEGNLYVGYISSCEEILGFSVFLLLSRQVGPNILQFVQTHMLVGGLVLLQSGVNPSSLTWRGLHLRLRGGGRRGGRLLGVCKNCQGEHSSCVKSH